MAPMTWVNQVKPLRPEWATPRELFDGTVGSGLGFRVQGFELGFTLTRNNLPFLRTYTKKS